MHRIVTSILLVATALLTNGCTDPGDPVAASGVRKAGVTLPTGSDGLTVEQRNVRDRLLMDNKLGSIKHLYVISAMSGQVLLYSTVRGKVTSSGKRLSPPTIEKTGYTSGHDYYPEILQDDGTYGSSIEYLFWWDQQGRYHQHYVTGGQILHISDQPISVPQIAIRLDESGDGK